MRNNGLFRFMRYAYNQWVRPAKAWEQTGMVRNAADAGVH